MGGYLIINIYLSWCSVKIACFRVGRALQWDLGYASAVRRLGGVRIPISRTGIGSKLASQSARL